MKNGIVKILIVDDNPVNIQVIGQILRKSRFKVGFAVNGKQALSILKETSSYDLVLLDIDMPEMDGFEVCRQIRRTDELKELPIIFVSAMSDINYIVNGFDEGGNEYITKPFNEKELLKRIQTQLNIKQLQDQLKMSNKILIEKNKELEKSRNELLTKNNFLEQFNQLMVDREMRIIDLKKEINSLCKRLGDTEKYTIV